MSLVTDNRTAATEGFGARDTRLLLRVFVVWAVGVGLLASYFLLDGALTGGLARLYLLPWCLATGAVVASPAFYLWLKGRFDPFHPLVYPAWIFFFPAFCVGGLVLVAGIAEPYYLAFVQDEKTELPRTLMFVMLGFAAMIVGYVLPFGRAAGEWVARRLPVADWTNEQIPGPGLVLLAIGFASTILGFGRGFLGYQRVDERGIFDGILFLLSLFLFEASFLLWLYIFRSEKRNWRHYAIGAVLIVTAILRAAFQGNRGSLIQVCIVVLFAFVFSGRRVKIAHAALGSVAVVVALFLGMVYGTTFRSIKGSEERVALGDYASMVGETLDRISAEDMGVIVERGLMALGERIESVSSLAVVVSNHEKLASYEDEYGLSENIWNDTVTFFIPRVIWNDKPVGIEPSKYGELYFNYADNSFAMTPIGDLLRNFGPVGIFVGMVVLGLILRFLYVSLREGPSFSYWRATLYFMLFTSISYEGTFGLIIPLLFKFGVFSVLGLIIVNLLVPKARGGARVSY